MIVRTPRSRRSLEIRDAVPLFREASQYAKTVAVVTDAESGFLEMVSSELEPDYIQLHILLSAAEIADAAETVSSGIIALAKPERSFAEAARDIASLADILMVDTFRNEMSGGTGAVHDWSASRVLREAIYPAKLMLSGGLNPANVEEAIRTVGPAIVDVSGGVESDGLKSIELVQAFIRKAGCSM